MFFQCSELWNLPGRLSLFVFSIERHLTISPPGLLRDFLFCVPSFLSIRFCYLVNVLVYLHGKIREKCLGEGCFAGFRLAPGTQSLLLGQCRDGLFGSNSYMVCLDFNFWNRSMGISLLQCRVQSLKGI